MLPDSFLCDLVVDPVRISPHTAINLSKLDWGTCVVGDGVFEILLEIAIVEENVRIIKPTIKMTLNAFDGLNDSLQLFISGQNNKCGVCSRFRRGYLRI